MDLTDIDASAWAELETAAADPQSGFRYVSLCSVDTEAKPQARMVVLRAADKSARCLEFHTDTRSSKWLELSVNPPSRSSALAPRAGCSFGLKGRSSFMGREAQVLMPRGGGCPRGRG